MSAGHAVPSPNYGHCLGLHPKNRTEWFSWSSLGNTSPDTMDHVSPLDEISPDLRYRNYFKILKQHRRLQHSPWGLKLSIAWHFRGIHLRFHFWKSILYSLQFRFHIVWSWPPHQWKGHVPCDIDIVRKQRRLNSHCFPTVGIVIKLAYPGKDSLRRVGWPSEI